VSVNNYDHKSIQMRRGTSAEWREYGDKCVPLEAEICVELMQNPDGTVNKHVGVKVGNGIDSYAQLPYVILNEETDPIFTSHPAFNISQEDIDNWNQSELKAGEKEGELTRWDGYAWVPTDRLLISFPEGIRANYDTYPLRDLSWDLGLETNRWKNIWGEDIYGTGNLNIGGNVNIEGNIDLEGSISIEGGIEIGSEIVDIEDFMRKSATNIVTEDWQIVLLDDDGSTPVIGIGPRGLVVQGIYSQDGILVGQGDAPGDKPSGSEDDKYGVSAPKINAQRYVVTPEIFAPQGNHLEITVDDNEEVRIHGDVDVDDSVTASEFIGDGAKITGIVTDQLADVQSEGANLDDFLIYSGTQWVAEPFHIETELNFMGSWNFTTAPPTNPTRGDLYINDTDGAMHSGWGPLAGNNVLIGNMVGWSEAKGRWYLLGDVASGAVVQVREGDCIVVDETQPDRPVVGLTPACQADIAKGVEAHGWGDHADEDYATEDWVNNLGFLTGITSGTAIIVDPSTNPAEPKISVSLGTSAADAAAGNHLHAQYLEKAEFNELSDKVDEIGTDLNNLHIQVDKNTDDIKDLQNAPGVDLTGYAKESWVSSNFDKYSWWNLTVEGATTTQIGTKATVDFRGSGGTTVVKSGNTITISSPTDTGGGGPTYTAGNMISLANDKIAVTDAWNGGSMKVNATSAGSSLIVKNETSGRGAELELRGSTGSSFLRRNSSRLEHVNSNYSTVTWHVNDSGNSSQTGSNTAKSFVKTGGTASQVLCADGSVVEKSSLGGSGGGGDNYQYWRLQANGGTATNVTSTAAVDFRGSGGASVTRSGNTITIYAPVSTGGGGDVDLSGYYTKAEVDGLLNNKQETLRAGNGISLASSYVAMTGKFSGSFTASGDVTAFGTVRAGENGEEVFEADSNDMIQYLLDTVEELKAEIAELKK